MSELRAQLEAGRLAHRGVAYPGDLAADVLAPEEVRRSLVLRVCYGAGALAAAAALTFAVLRVGTAMGTDPNAWRQPLADLGDRGRALAASVSSGLPNDWELPALPLPQMSRPSELPRHLRMMSPINRVRQPGLPTPRLPKLQGAGDSAESAQHAA